MRCGKKHSNVKLPKYSNRQKLDYYMGEDQYFPEYDDKQTLKQVKEGKIPPNDDERERKFHYFSCELQLMDAYSKFVNVLCDTNSMDIYFEGFDPLPKQLHKKKENQLSIGKYYEKFPHIRCATFSLQKDRVDCKYWFHSDIEFDKKNWWNEMEGIVVSYSSCFSLHDTLKNTSKSKKNEMKRVNVTINLGHGKSNILLENISDFEKDFPNIELLTTVYASETQCFNVLYQYLKRASITLNSTPSEDAIILKNISLPHLTYFTFEGKYQENLDPTTKTLKLHHVKLDNFNAPLLYHFGLEYMELSVENQQVFTKLETLELKYSKFRKDYLIEKHCDSIETLDITNSVETFEEKLDFHFDSKFHKLRVLKIAHAKDIQVVELSKLNDVYISSSTSFHAKDCKITKCNISLVIESVKIEQPHHPISSSFYMHPNPNTLYLSSPSCERLSLGFSSFTDETICEVNIGEIKNFALNMYTSTFTITDSSNFLILPYSSNIDVLELNISNNNRLTDMLITNLKQSSIRKVKFGNLPISVLKEILSKTTSENATCQEYEFSEAINISGLNLNGNRQLNLPLQDNSTNSLEKLEFVLSTPGLLTANITVYAEKIERVFPTIQSSTLNNLTLSGYGEQKLFNWGLDFEKLSNLETLKISEQMKFSNTSIHSNLKSLTISKSQTAELDLSFFPLLENLTIETCQNLKMYYSKEIVESRLKLVNINLIGLLDCQFPSFSLSSLQEIFITNIKKTISKSLINLKHAKRMRIKIIHLADKFVVKQTLNK